MSSTPLLSVEHLTIEYRPKRGAPVRLVDDVSFELLEHETLGVAGESGSGKTLTSMAILRLLDSRYLHVTGSVFLEGRDILTLSRREMRRIRGSQMAVVFQEPMTSLHPSMRVGEQIAEVVRLHSVGDRRAAWRRAVEMLRLVGIPDPEARASQYAHEFSGGMQQRAMIALALSCEPKLLIADEPTTALDVTIQAQIVELLRELQARVGMSVLFVTHDLGLLSGLADRVQIMYAGQIVESAPAAELFRDPRHPYTHGLIRSAPHPDLKGTVLPSIPGAPPQPGEFEYGCRFSPRCSFAVEECRTQPIELRMRDERRASRCIRHDEFLATVRGVTS